MLVVNEIEIGSQILKETFSDKGFYILQNETGIKYGHAIDVLNAPYTYTETDELIPQDEDFENA